MKKTILALISSILTATAQTHFDATPVDNHHLSESEMITNLLACDKVKMVNCFSGVADSYGNWSCNFLVTNSTTWGVKDFQCGYVCFAQSGTILKTGTFKAYSFCDPRTNSAFQSFILSEIPSQTARIDAALLNFEIVDYFPPPSSMEIALISKYNAMEVAKKKADNAAKALKYNQDLADKGDPYGELRMGERYRDGDGVAKDLRQAREWFAKAAAQGDPTAAKALAALP